MLIKKIGGNWHRVETWNDFIIGYKSGGIIIVNSNLPKSKEFYIPFYSFSGFKIENNILYIWDEEDQTFQLDLEKLKLLPANYKSQITMSEVTNEIAKSFCGGSRGDTRRVFSKRFPLVEEPRAVDNNDRITVVAYKQKGIDFFQSETEEKIAHFDFPGYSFIDDIKLQGNKLYVADVFGLRILDITDIERPILDDRFADHKGWAKDSAVYKHYLLVADVVGIKIFDKNKDFALVGKIETNRNRVAKVVTYGDYAFLSCEAVGLKISDLSEIEHPRLISGIVLPKGVWDCDVYDGHAYLAAYTGGLIKVDCTKIKNLVQEACYTGTEEIIGVHVNERAVYAACSYDGFKIFDHHLNLIAAAKGIHGRCWTILENDGYLYVAAGKGGAYIYDVNELDDPLLVNRVKTVEARDLVIKNNRLYIADGRNGVVVFNISDIHKIKNIDKIPSAAFTRSILVDGSDIYKADGDGGVEVYER
jgi:hypothetical protein